MTTRNTAIALATAAAIGLGSLAPVGQAQAAGFAPIAKTEITTGAEGIEEAGRRRRHNGAAIALGLGAFALGLAIASDPHHPRHRHCYYERVKVWDPYIGAYVIRKELVC